MRPKFCDRWYNSVCPSPANFREEKKEENWSERFLLEVYIGLWYFSLIIFSTIELTSYATCFARCELCSLLTISIGTPLLLKPKRKIHVYSSHPYWVWTCLQIRGGIHIIFFLFLDENSCMFGYSLEAPHWGASNEYPQHAFLWRNKKDTRIFLMKKVPYLLLFMT